MVELSSVFVEEHLRLVNASIFSVKVWDIGCKRKVRDEALDLKRCNALCLCANVLYVF